MFRIAKLHGISPPPEGGGKQQRFHAARYACLVFALLLAASVQAADKPLKVYATFHPLAEFTRAIGGAAVDVVNALPEGQDAAFWIPSREVVLALQQADLIVVNGCNFEKGLAVVSLPESRVVDTSAFLKGSEIVLDAGIVHSHGSKGAHKHEGVDGHTWVDPRTAARQCQAICDALGERRPESAAQFKANLDAVNKQFEELDRLLREKVAKSAADKQLLAAHPAYNYLARSYSLKIKSFHLTPDQAPAPEILKQIEGFLKAAPAGILLWEEQPKPEIEALFKEKFKLRSVVYSPCESLSPEQIKAGKNYFTVMKENIENLWRALEEK